MRTSPSKIVMRSPFLCFFAQIFFAFIYTRYYKNLGSLFHFIKLSRIMILIHIKFDQTKKSPVGTPRVKKLWESQKSQIVSKGENGID